MTIKQFNEPGRLYGQLMPLEADPSQFPCVVMRRTCQVSDQYLGRLPASQGELDEYKRNCGMSPEDIYVLQGGAKVTPKVKPFSYGDGVAIMLLSGQAVGLAAANVDDATSWLAGKPLPPMSTAAMETEAVRLHNLIAVDNTLVDAANQKAAEIKSRYGWPLQS